MGILQFAVLQLYPWGPRRLYWSSKYRYTGFFSCGYESEDLLYRIKHLCILMSNCVC